MTTTNFTLTDVYEEVADGASLITMAAGEFARLHIGTVQPVDTVPPTIPFHPLIVEKGTDRGFPFGGTEKVYARKDSKDTDKEVKLAVTPVI